MPVRWKVSLLGGLQIEADERIITHFRTRKTGLLLAYLALARSGAPGGPALRRDLLIDRLWRDHSIESGRHNLSLSLSALRKRLEPPDGAPGAAILADRSSVRLNPETVTTDVLEFEAALARAQQIHDDAERARALAAAADLYRGPLLPGYFEEGLLAEQERLAGRHFAAVRELLSLLERAGQLDQALHYARRAVEFDPLREQAHQELICLLVAVGNSAAALRQYGQLERNLEEELGCRPSGLMQGLAAQIRAGTFTGRSAAGVPTACAPGSAGFEPSVSPPSGTVTILLAAIEGPAPSRSGIASDADTAQQSQLRTLRERIQRSRSYELKRDGGPPATVFDSAAAGLAFALDSQRALDPAIPVAMALHSGDARLDGGEYSGATWRVAEGLLRAAHPGQVVCCEATAILLRRSLAAEVRLNDLGVYCLEDVARPERIFQVEYPGMARRDFPPPMALPARRRSRGPAATD